MYITSTAHSTGNPSALQVSCQHDNTDFFGKYRVLSFIAPQYKSSDSVAEGRDKRYLVGEVDLSRKVHRVTTLPIRLKLKIVRR
jgi:hypothetical protein